jgi:hypothetical protein
MTSKVDRKFKEKKTSSLRSQLSLLTIPVLKNILRLNHQNPFGNKPELLTRIVYLSKHGAYPSCPKCIQGRLKLRVHRRKDQSKYYCPGYPIGFRAGSSYHQCDYITDECEKISFHFPSTLNLIVEK